MVMKNTGCPHVKSNHAQAIGHQYPVTERVQGVELKRYEAAFSQKLEVEPRQKYRIQEGSQNCQRRCKSTKQIV